MKEAIRFWKDKVILPAHEFYALDWEKRATAFTVAGLMKADELLEVHRAIGKAIKQGKTLNDFKKELGTLFERKGWRRHRVETIFRTNIQTAYHVGRYRQMAEMVDVMPYWMYDAVNDSRTRPSHAAMDGKVYPATHPVWKVWYPINGYNCRCSVITLSERHMKRLGLKVETEHPGFMPDPGFRTNPGRDYWGSIESIAKDKLKKYPPALRQKVASSLEDTFGTIRSFRDIDRIIRERLSDEFSRGYGGLKLTSATYFMATDPLRGTLYISQRGWQKPDGTKFYPYRSIKDAFKKLGKQPLSFDEEYSLESLWHEVVHNKQVLAPLYNEYERRTMELVTQWYARRTYPELLTKLGGFSAIHHEAIKAGGYGYSLLVKRFDELLSRWNIPEDRLFSHVGRIIKNVPKNRYLQELAKTISDITDKDYYVVLNELSLVASTL